MFHMTEGDPDPNFAAWLNFDAWLERERLNPSPWTLTGLEMSTAERDRLRYTHAGALLKGVTDDPAVTLTLTRLRGIEHLGVYASSYPGRQPRHRAPEGIPYSLADLGVMRDGWAWWFAHIKRRAETDPDDWPGKHAIPPERGLYAVRKLWRSVEAILKLSADVF